MVEPKLDEVDGECPVTSDLCRQKLNLKDSDFKKSLTDSGMDEGSNSGSLDTVGENSDDNDDDDVVVRKPKKSMQRILDDDDSDSSQDVPCKTTTLSQNVPCKTATLSQDVPCKTATLSQDVPCKTATLSQDVPSKTATLSQDVPSKTATLSQDIPCKTATLSQDVPSKTATLSPDVPSKKGNISQDVQSQHVSQYDHRFDMSKEVIDMREQRKQGLTAEEALEVIMQDSSDENDETDKLAKKKRVKRPTSDSSSDEENEQLSLMDTIKKNTAETGTEDLFDSEEADKQNGGMELENEKDGEVNRKIPDNLFDDENSDTSGCNSSGSEVEKSDHEQADEGFDESTIDPKLLAKLKKGASKNPKRQTKREEMQSIHSESQRLVRESRVNIPYHQPVPRSLNDFLERANRKQQEYKILKGFRDSTKAHLMQDILQRIRIQSKPKTQDKLDKYSDSDEDWNPEKEKEKSLKTRIDEKIRIKSSVAMPLGEIKLSVSPVKDKTSVITDADDDDLPDLYVASEINVKKSKKLNSDCGDTDIEMEENSEKVNEVETECAQVVEETDTECVQYMEIIPKDSQVGSDQCNSAVCDTVTGKHKTDTPDDLLYDWEKDDSKDKELDENSDKDIETANGCSNTCERDKSDENKENIDPNKHENDQSEDVEVLTPSQTDNTSPTSSSKKKRKKIAALVGIDLDDVKPRLSGNMETFITLEDSVAVPKHPGVQKLMDRLCKHSAKTEKSHTKDTDISIISKDAIGIDKEELKLTTFTYHTNEEETNPLLKFETPGAKLVALKEQLEIKMKAKREMARQKRQEVYDLDNEEGGFEEEGEMSEHSDTDIEDEGDFEEQYGEDEEEMEEVDEEQEEKNAFADDEAAEDGDIEDEGNDDEDIEEEYNLKLDLTDEEESEHEDDTDGDGKSSGTDEETEEKPIEFKEPKEACVPEKPFSMFGRKSRETSISETQFPSGQRKSSTLPMPIEDSQDLYGSMLPEINHTHGQKPTHQAHDFSFFLEDSQSNMLDADGYIKTKSTGKKKPMAPAIAGHESASTQNNMDELLGLCSGRFMESGAVGKDKTSRKNLFDESSVSSSQGNMDELAGLCSGVFAEKPSTQSEKKGTKRVASEAESDDDSIAAYSDNGEKLSDKAEESGDEAGGNGDNDDVDTGHIDSEVEEEQSSKFSGFTLQNKHGKIRQEFVDEEAELSGSECDSDENLDLAEEDDIMEIEEGDKDAAKLNQEELRDEVGRIHLKQLIDEDKRELLRYQEMYLPDGDLYSEGGGRTRRFRWSNMGDDESQQDMFNDGSDVEEQQEDVDDFTWRKERYEREKFLKEQQDENNDGDNSQFLKLGKVFLKKQVSVDNSSSDKSNKTLDTGAETPGFPGSFYKLSQQKRGSFLARSKEALAKIAEMTKPVVNPSAGAKSSGKFTFHVISPDKVKEAESSSKGKQRKAHAPKQMSVVPRSKQPPAKRPKLDTHSSFTENSIFHHM